MRVFSAIGRSLRAFVEDRRGSFAVITGAILTVLVLSAGFALNLAQLYNVKSSLGQALDSAVTSTARDITTGTIEPDDARGMVEAFLKANGDPELIRSDRLVLDRLVIDQLNNTIEATAYVDVDLFFPLFGLSDQRRVSNLSATVYSDRNIEVAMMLDVTGSMDGQKIEDLKDAAENAVEALLGNQDAKNPRVRVAIVPYAEAVNTGKLADTVFVEKEGGSNLPPPIDKAETVSAKGRIDNCATERKDKDGAADFSDDGPYSERKNKKGKTYLAKVNRDDRISIDPDTKKTMCPAAELIPLTADKQKLLDTIEDFKADGVTAGGIAAQWGYYMLSPKWRSAIKEAGMGAGPADHDRRRVAKVAILMTDGQFNTAFAGVQDRRHAANAAGHEVTQLCREAVRQHEARRHRCIYHRLRSRRSRDGARRKRAGEIGPEELLVSGQFVHQALFRSLDRRRTGCGFQGNHRQYRKAGDHQIA